MRCRPSRTKLTRRSSAIAARRMLSADSLRCGTDAAADSGFEGRWVVRIRVITREPDAGGARRHGLRPRRTRDRSPLLGDHARPFGLADAGEHRRELALATLGELIERHLLMIALRADHAGETAFLAEQRAAVEHPLHDAIGEPEHGEGQAHALG